ncbi:MAG: STAS domain-containing protein, partial [Pseudomonadota bacterium]
DAPVIRAEGRVDSSNAAELEGAAMAALRESEGGLVFDLGALGYMSSAGLRVLLVALKACKARGGRVGLAAPQPNVLKVLEMSGFAKMFALGDDVPEAAAALR